MIAELFELAKLDAREIDLHLEPFSLCELGQDVLQRFELPAAAKQLELRSELSPTLPMVSADIRLIERVLVNLVDNAIRYTPSGGCISLVCVAHGADVLVEVSDTGPGIPSADLPHLFDRFYRVSGRGGETNAGTAQGAGLGLAIAKRILDLHGRTLGVRTNANAGASLEFTLPAVRGVDADPTA